MLSPNIQKAVDQSVQTAQPNTEKQPYAIDGMWDMFVVSHPEIVSAWGSKRRDRELREMSYITHNGLFQGAIAGLIMRVQATPWEIQAGRNIARYYQDMLQNSDFHDWENWIARTLWDFFTQDFGAVAEVIGAGDPTKPVSGRVLGLAHMDALSCYTTKSNAFPIVYWNEEDNSMHRMEQTRVHRFTDMVSPRRLSYGNGLCALSRYLSEANVDILLGRHDNEMLNDLPPAGLMTIQGMTDTQVQQAIAMYEANRRADGQSVFRNTMILYGMDVGNALKVENHPFSTLPENFDTEKFVNMHVNKLALALGVDPQDIWPLSGQALGTGTQSTILHSKSQGKMFGRVLQMITRFINRKVLPDGAEFAFKFKDSESDETTARTAQLWVDLASKATWLTDDEKRRLVADMVEPIADVITDENGELVELPDDDPKADEQTVIVAPDANPLGQAPNQPDVQANVSGQTGAPNAGNDVGGVNATVSDQRKFVGGNGGSLLDRGHDTHAARKDYNDTLSSFTDDVAAILQDAEDGSINKAAFSIRMRQSINQYGRNAYLDGLNAGGVETDTLEGDDSAAFAALLASQSGYVSDIATRLYKDDGTVIGGADYNASLWGNKTLQPFYDAGVMSSDANGMYEWRYGDTEHCVDCLRLNGQRHRMKDWMASDYMPKGDDLECGGFNCQCELVKTTGRAKGNY